MKKLVLTILSFILFLYLISLASAAEIKLSKEVYQPSETLQAEIYGNFLDTIKPENINFYRERNIPVEYDILKLKDKYLLYALLPPKEGNYTLKIKNVRYETDTGVTQEIAKEFSIKATNVTIISVNPGFVIAKEDFYITVKANKNTDINTEFLGKSQKVSFIENKEEKIHFSIGEVKNYTETTLKIENYNIFIFILPNKSQGIEETSKFRFLPLEIEASLLKDESYFFKVSLINFGNKNITNIKISSNVSGLEVKIEPDSISNLEAGEKEFINLTLSSEKVGEFYGKILAEAENISAKININIAVTENKSEINITKLDYSPGYIEEKSCTEIGKFCKVDEKCSAPLELTLDGYCCKGECVAEKESSRSWIYGLIIIIAVVAGLIFFSFYMKKKQKKAIDILKEREQKYKERMSSTSEEVRGGLTKT